MHLLGLNWQLQPADGHTFNNGIRTGLPGSDDVATMPSGGKGEVTVAACPLEVTGKVRAPLPPGSGFLIQILEGMQKRRKGEEKELPFSCAPVPSCLLSLSGSWAWLEPLGAGKVPAWSYVHT